MKEFESIIEGISKGNRRVSNFGEITTSRVGVVEGSKCVCDFENDLKPKDEVDATAAAICAVPELLKLMEGVDQYLKGGHYTVSKEELKKLVDQADEKMGEAKKSLKNFRISG